MTTLIHNRDHVFGYNSDYIEHERKEMADKAKRRQPMGTKWTLVNPMNDRTVTFIISGRDEMEVTQNDGPHNYVSKRVARMIWRGLRQNGFVPEAE